MAYDQFIADQIGSSEESYFRAVREKIKFNARKGRSQRFLADPTDGYHNAYIAAKLDHYYHAKDRPKYTEEQNAHWDDDDYAYEIKAVAQAIKDFDRKNPRDGFLNKMWQSLFEWGSLTEKQVAAVENAFARREEFLANIEKKNAERAASSDYIGTVGERTTFTAKVIRIRSGAGNFGTWYITTMKCEKTGQDIVYKNKLNIKDTYDEDGHAIYHWVEEGDVVEFTAKIKSHSEFNGVKQTVLQRATKSKIITKKENA